eukprot:364170-Chlamydomonas_euryale.AAC.10
MALCASGMLAAACFYTHVVLTRKLDKKQWCAWAAALGPGTFQMKSLERAEVAGAQGDELDSDASDTITLRGVLLITITLPGVLLITITLRGVLAAGWACTG